MPLILNPLSVSGFRHFGLLVICFFSAFKVVSQELPYDVKANYTKTMYSIPMRDGIKLFTTVYEPKDQSKKYPILFNRTPYGTGPYGPDEYKTQLGGNELLQKSGFIYVFQDVRGRFMSEGVFQDVRPFKPVKKGSKDIDESTDAYDSMTWLLKKLKNHNGKIGMWGISYPGFYAAMGALSNHPNLVAVSPQAPVMDWFAGDDFHHNGAFFLPHAFNFFSSFGKVRNSLTIEGNPPFNHGTSDGYYFFKQMGPLENANRLYLNYEIPFWNDLMEHPNYDAFWKDRNALQHFSGIKAAVLVVGGLFDAENLYGATNLYKTIEKKNPKATNFLALGPWSHGQWGRGDGQNLGPINFDSKTSVFFRKKIEFEFFNHYLKGNTELELPEAYVFETGSNVWKAYKTWPPEEVEEKELVFFPSGKLAIGLEGLPSGNANTEYVSDPNKPVPFTEKITTQMLKEYMVEDQRFAGRRPDVLVFETPPLKQDITMTGPLLADLFVSTSTEDADFVVKLIDVYPDNVSGADASTEKLGGYQMLVRGDVMRGRFRNSLEKPEPLSTTEVNEVKFQLCDVNHTFKAGHRIMVQVQSTWFPLVDINPQKFVNINTAKSEDFQKSRIKVMHPSRYPSQIKYFQLRK
ncbi:MAG TPA: CocE/NonD family hydrolase [Catalimonadaceae bacterium]|nr:CocE/NonD family hydrolase [Catalimonadaceae bacterium]